MLGTWLVAAAISGSGVATPPDPPRVVGAAGAFAEPSRRPRGRRGGVTRAERDRQRGFGARVHRFLPVPSFRAEPAIGLTFGLRARYVYRPPDQQFDRVRVDLVGLVSTRLVQDHSLTVRTRDLLHRQEIVDLSAVFNDDPVFPYIGIADDAFYRQAQLENDYFRIDRRTIGGSLSYQQPFAVVERGRWGMKTTGYARWFVGTRFAYDDLQADPDSRYALDTNTTRVKLRRGGVLGGIAWDSRDNGWSPVRGSLHDASVELGGPWMASSRTWVRLNASTRFYRPLGTDKLILANQFLADVIVGDAPLVSQGEFGGLLVREGIGGRDLGRGFYRRRFVGRRKLYASAELRFEPYEFKILRRYVSPGLKVFTDVGSAAAPPRFLSRAPHISGGGGAYLIWDRFFVLRFDAGVSEEGLGLYVTANHAF